MFDDHIDTVQDCADTGSQENAHLQVKMLFLFKLFSFFIRGRAHITLSRIGGGSLQMITVLHRGGLANDSSIP